MTKHDVLERLANARALLEPEERDDILRSVLLAEDDDSEQGSVEAAPVNRRRRTGAVLGVVGALAAASLIVVLAQGGGPRVGRPTSSLPKERPLPGIGAVRARLDAALDAASGDIVKITRSGSTCLATSWIAPFNVQPGDRFRELTLSKACGTAHGSSAQTLDFSVERVVPLKLLTPSNIGDVVGAGDPVIPGKSGGVAFNVGEYVCGTGSESGYDTSFDSAWAGSSKTLLIQVPATPELLRSEVAAGSLRLVGSAMIAGKRAVELSLLVPLASKIGVAFSLTLYLDASTYLPLREVQVSQNKHFAGQPPTVPHTFTEDFSFLSPSAANLRLLTTATPSGLMKSAVPGTFGVPSCAVLPGDPPKGSAQGASGSPGAA